MSEPYYRDESVELWHGDALAVLRALPDESVDCVVTSPPYFGLRDYGVEGQQGLEGTPAEYVAGMVAVFAQVRRVLAADGTCWLNLGDSYASTTSNNGGYSARSGLRDGVVSSTEKGRRANDSGTRRTLAPGLPAKNLLGVPWRVAIALQDDGWYLRNDIIWAKPNGMPESITDRLSTKHEHVFLLTKAARYWFDLDPIREPLAQSSMERLAQDVDAQQGSQRANGGTRADRPMRAVSARDSFARATKEAAVPVQSTAQHRSDRPDVVAGSPLGRNPGDVWTIPTQPFAEAHFACMPVALAERCILAGCKPGGIVLDPYSGSGTTGLAATKHGRRYVGIDLNAEYLDLSLRTRLAQTALIEVTA